MRITENENRRHVLCDRCKVPANLIKVRGQLQQIVCPECGATEPYAAFDEIVAQGMEAGFTKMFASVAAGSKALEFTPGRPRRKYKFFLDLN